jgi:phospholipase/carboxylesterase
MMENAKPLLLGEAPQSAAVVCVFTHGRNQSPEAMAEHVVRHLSVPGVAYVLPRAPAGSWYDAKAVDPLTGATRLQLSNSIDHLREITGTLPGGKPVLMAGFSQGACLSLEYAMRHGPWEGALASLTGCRVGSADDERPRSDLAGMPAYITGADADPWIPLAATAQATLELGTAKARVRADVFPGRAHEVSPDEIRALDGMLRQLAEGEEVKW